MSGVFQYPKWKACVILISLGILIFVAFGISNLKRDYSSLCWPSASGIIRSATLEHSGFFNGPNARAHVFSADISYNYKIAGVLYSGTRVSFSDPVGGSYGGFWHIYINRGNKNQVTRVLDHYPKGKQVTVFYDPNNPTTAILEPKITGRTWTALAFSMVFLLWGALPVIVFISRTEHDKHDAAC